MTKKYKYKVFILDVQQLPCMMLHTFMYHQIKSNCIFNLMMMHNKWDGLLCVGTITYSPSLHEMEYSFCKLMISTTRTIKVHNICNALLLNTTFVPSINCMFFMSTLIVKSLKWGHKNFNIWNKNLGKTSTQFYKPSSNLKISHFGPLNFQLLST